MALFGRKKTTVGLDIGSGLVKVAVIDHSKSTPELIKVAITPLPDDAIVEGEVMVISFRMSSAPLLSR